MSPPAENTRQHATEFLACAGHELRTPLNAIVGMLDLSLEEPLSTALRDYLTTARTAAQTLVQTVDDVLDLAQADAGNLQFARDRVRLDEIAAVAVSTAERLLRRKGVSIDMRIDASLNGKLRGDARRIRQVIEYLLLHVLHRTRDRRLIVEIRAARETSSHVELELGISRMGVGRAQDRPDYQLFDPLLESKYSTPGLGLTVAECWLQNLGGELWTTSESSASAGAYARFVLPKTAVAEESAIADGALDVNSVERRTEIPAHRVPTRPLRVLVADDTAANQRVVEAVLTRRGHRVELAEDGRQALDRVRQQPFDVVLMDAQMPLMNGLQAAEAIRHLPDPAASRVPIIAMTAHAMHDDRQQCLAAGMDDYLPKPLDVAALVARVEFHGASTHLAETEEAQTAAQSASAPREFIAGALARLGGDEDLLKELIRLFRKDARMLVEKMHVALGSQDQETLARAAHNLRGLMANFDAERGVAAALQIERAALAGNIAADGQPLKVLEQELERLLQALERYESDEDPLNGQPEDSLA